MVEEVDELEQAFSSVMPKSSLELEIERIQAEKRALLRYKKKQQRLYQRIREEHQARVYQSKMANTETCVGDIAGKDLVNSYVQNALHGITGER